MLIFCVHKTAFYVHEDPLYSHLCPSECPPARIFPHTIPSPSSPPSLPRILPCHPVTPVTPVTVTTWKGTSHPPWGSGSWYKQQKDFGDQLNGDQRKKLQIFGCIAGGSTNIYIFQIWISQWRGPLRKKVTLRYFSGNDLICHSRKFQPSQTPLHVFLPISSRYLTVNIFHWIFG